MYYVSLIKQSKQFDRTWVQNRKNGMIVALIVLVPDSYLAEIPRCNPGYHKPVTRGQGAKETDSHMSELYSSNFFTIIWILKIIEWKYIYVIMVLNWFINC